MTPLASGFKREPYVSRTPALFSCPDGRQLRRAHRSSGHAPRYTTYSIAPATSIGTRQDSCEEKETPSQNKVDRTGPSATKRQETSLSVLESPKSCQLDILDKRSSAQHPLGMHLAGSLDRDRYLALFREIAISADIR